MMASETVAPWAEPVLHTAGDLLALADDSWHYELVQGRLVRMPQTNLEHSDVCLKLLLALQPFVEARNLGRVTMPETGFIVSGSTEPDTVLAPDLAYVRSGRLPEPGTAEGRTFARLAPDLVIEIASPSQHRLELAAKAGLWLSSGSRAVWAVWPVARQVDVWSPSTAEPVTLTQEDTLQGGNVLPDFELPISTLW